MKKNILLFTVVAVITVLHVKASADDFIKAGNRADNDTKITLLSSDNNKTSIKAEVNGFYNSRINIFNGIYDQVSLPGYVSLGETGQASLPVITKYIAIPDNKNVRVQIENAVSREFGSYIPIPYQAPPLRGTKESNTPFVKDDNYYSLNAYSPAEIVSVKEIAVMRDYRIAVITINPVQYNPAEKKLKVYTDITFSLNYEGYSDVNNAGYTASPRSGLFNEMYKSLIFNYRDTSENTAPRMLIITADNLYDAIVPFADWKNAKGIATTINKASELGFGSNPTQSQIKDFILSGYNSAERPDYVMIIGDVLGTNTVPWFTVGYDKSDHPFTCLAGTDIFPDVAFGRISVQTAAELNKAVEKLIQYEKEPYMAETSWYRRALVIRSNDGMDPLNGEIMKSLFLNEGGFTNVDVVTPSTNNLITGFLNGGVSWVWFIGHGDPTSWADPVWDMSNMVNLTFGKKHPQIISTACANADLDFSTSDGFGEAWIERNQLNSASNIAAYTENCAFYTSDSIGKEMLYGYFRKGIHDFGSMVNYGKIKAYGYFNGNYTVVETINQFLMLGDPSQITYSDIPKPLTVTTNQVNSSSSFYNINVKANGEDVKSSLVGISQAGELKASGFTDSLGNFSFDASVLNSGGFDITVTGKNLLPYQNSILTSISGNAGIPAEYSLHQNFPNPFNPVTNIKFTLPEGSYVTLKVYNMLGSEVASIVNENLTPGSYSYNFDGAKLSSGVYFYKLTAGSFTDVKKMSLIK